LSELEFKNYVREIGRERFSDVENKSNATPINYSEKVSKFLIALSISSLLDFFSSVMVDGSKSLLRLP